MMCTTVLTSAAAACAAASADVVHGGWVDRLMRVSVALCVGG